MKKISKLTIVLFMLLNFESYSLAENNFLKKEKINMTNRNMKNLNFCFKEVLFLTPRIKTHIYI